MSASPSPVSRDTVSSAVAELGKWMHGRSASSRPQLLLDDRDDFFILLLSLRRIPSKSRTNPFLLPLPHPIFPLSISDPTAAPSVFLIIDDRTPHSPPPSKFLEEAKEYNLPVSEVVGISTLRTDYRPFESRRKLCGSHDLFLADKKIIPLLPRLLGKEFFLKKKIPLPVNFSRVGWKDQIKRILNSTFLYIRSGTTSGIRVGRLSMEVEQVVENVMAVIDEAAQKIPKKWGNVRSLHLKAVDSVALPIYQALPEIGMKIEIGEREDDSGFEEVIDGDDAVVGKKKTEKKNKKKGGIRYMDGPALIGEELVEDDNAEEEGDKKKKSKKRKKNAKEGNADGTKLDDLELKVTKKKKKGNGGETDLKTKKKKKTEQENTEADDVNFAKTKKKEKRGSVDKVQVVSKEIVENTVGKEKRKGKKSEAVKVLKEIKKGKKNKLV